MKIFDCRQRPQRLNVSLSKISIGCAKSYAHTAHWQQMTQTPFACVGMLYLVCLNYNSLNGLTWDDSLSYTTQNYSRPMTRLRNYTVQSNNFVLIISVVTITHFNMLFWGNVSSDFKWHAVFILWWPLKSNLILLQALKFLNNLIPIISEEWLFL